MSNQRFLLLSPIEDLYVSGGEEFSALPATLQTSTAATSPRELRGLPAVRAADGSRPFEGRTGGPGAPVHRFPARRTHRRPS